jgi:hypothetical protein
MSSVFLKATLVKLFPQQGWTAIFRWYIGLVNVAHGNLRGNDVWTAAWMLAALL